MGLTKELFKKQGPLATSLAGCQGMTPLEVQENAEVYWPEAHKDPELMAELTFKAKELTGLKNVRIPFDACLEPEIFGAEVDWGSKKNDPYINNYPYTENPEEIEIPHKITDKGRVPVVKKAIELLNNKNTDVIATTVIGPTTLLGEVMGTENLLRKTLTDRDLVENLINKLTEVPIKLIEHYSEAGADVIQVIEPYCSTDMITPDVFKEVSAPNLNEIHKSTKKPLILHICGEIDEILPTIGETEYEAITIHPGLNPKEVRGQIGEDKEIIGNISPDIMAHGTPKEVEKATEKAIEKEINLIEPDDGYVSIVPLENIKALTKTVEKHR